MLLKRTLRSRNNWLTAGLLVLSAASITAIELQQLSMPLLAAPVLF
jgi:hypothetical protein